MEPVELRRSEPIKVSYSTNWQKALLVCCWLAAPIWIVVSLASICIAAFASYSVWLFAFPFSVIPILAYRVLADSNLRIDNHGITFPTYLAPFIGFRRTIPWSAMRMLGYTSLGGISDGALRIDLLDQDVIWIEFRVLSRLPLSELLKGVRFYGKAVEQETPLKQLDDSVIWPKSLAVQTVWLSPEQQLLEDKQLELTYSGPLRRISLWMVFFLFPIWGVIGVLGTFALPFVLLLALSKPGLVALTACMPLMFTGGVVATAGLFDTTLTVGETGISFPLYMAPLLRFRRERIWKEITRLRFIPRGNKLRNGIIEFHFPSGAHVQLRLKRMAEQDLERLMLALSIWGQRIEKDPEIKVLQEELSNQKLGYESLSYTKMWEDEMNRRFSSTSFVPLQPGASLKSGQLTVTKQLAFGGLSAVYLAQVNHTDLVTLKEFVVPETSPELKSKAAELFEREAQILMKLSHPRLARVHDCFVEDGRTYLELDYIPGTDLRQIVLQKGKLPEQTVVEWTRQICEILKYLHSQNPPVIHRDLTPDNILLTAEEQIRLIDFGAANEFVGTATGTLVGKQSFIAPEQFRGDTVPQSDLYSLGATMFYLLTAQEPQPLSQSFPSQTEDHISKALDRLVADCTAFEPAERIQSVDEIKKRLAECSANVPAQVE